jgi:cell division septation protein DedD
MAENRRGKENRFYFSRGQMVLLGGAFTLASLVIFILGIFVGKGIEERKLVKREEPLVKIPVKPGAQESSAAATPQAKDEITFNDSLPPVGGTVALAEEKPKETKAAEKVAAQEVKEKTIPLKPEALPAKVAEKHVEKVALAENAPKKTDSAPGDTKELGKTWRAQVNAYPDDRSAKQIVDRLKNKGYNAYVTEVQNRGKTWYRVSVGKYTSHDEADKVAELLRGKENFPKTFVASR